MTTTDACKSCLTGSIAVGWARLAAVVALGADGVGSSDVPGGGEGVVSDGLEGQAVLRRGFLHGGQIMLACQCVRMVCLGVKGAELK